NGYREDDDRHRGRAPRADRNSPLGQMAATATLKRRPLRRSSTPARYARGVCRFGRFAASMSSVDSPARQITWAAEDVCVQSLKPVRIWRTRSPSQAQLPQCPAQLRPRNATPAERGGDMPQAVGEAVNTKLAKVREALEAANRFLRI